MDEKKNEEIKKDMGEESGDVITVVDDYDDFQTMVKDRKNDSSEAEHKKAASVEEDINKKNSAKEKESINDKAEEKKEATKDKLEEKKESAKDKLEEKKEAINDKLEEKKEATKDKLEEKKESAKEKAEEKKEALKEKVDEKKEAAKEKIEEKTDSVKEKAEKEKESIKDKVEKEVAATKEEIDNKPYIDNTKKSSGAKKGILITLGVVASLLIIAYIAGFVYFSSHFYQYASVNGIDVAGMDKASAKSVLDNFYKNYKITLETIDLKEAVIDGKDIDAKVNVHDNFDDLYKQQETYLWFVNMFEIHDFKLDADATWNEDKLNDLLSSMDFLDEANMKSPEDAYIGVNDNKFEIIKEVLGSTINREKFDSKLAEAIASVQSSLNLYDAGCYELPKVYADDEELVKEYEGKKEYAQYVVNIQMDDLLLEPGMDLYDAVFEKSGDSYQISKTKVAKYVNDLANQYDTMGKERTFTTSFSGKKITTQGTAFGYELDKEATTNALYNALTAGKASTVEAVFISKGKTLQGENDIGDTYVEVNLSEQRVIAYKNGKKFAEGDCVSGNEAAGHGTTTGLYQVQDKLSPTVLRGEKKPVTKTVTKKNKKGKKVKKTETTYEYEYESPVTYWLQFNGGQGLHDAAGWRSAYGGSIYYYSGSHGCVNLPLDLAKQLYETIQVGDPVIVYFWDNENRK